MNARSKLLLTAVALSPLVLASGCGGFDQDDFQTPTAPGSPFIELVTETGELVMKANGARLGIIATIDANSTERTIKFTTTEGTFAGAPTATPKTIQVTIDGLGKARADLISSASLVTAVVTAEVMGKPEVARSIEIRFDAPEFSLRSEGGKTTLRADGEDSVALIASIPANSQNRFVRFTTDRGTLVGGSPTANSTNADRDREVAADAAGEATMLLKSSTDPGVALVAAEPKGAPAFRRTLQIFFDAPDDVIEFVTAPATAPADGATASEFTVEVALQQAGLEVEFETTAGSFSPTVATKDMIEAPVSQGTATAVLYSPADIRRGKVSATVPPTGSSFSTETFIDFVRALPTRIEVELSDVTVSDNLTDSIVVTAKLLRDVGKVTVNTVVTFEARFDMTGEKFGLFEDVELTNAQGVATAKFRPLSSGLIGDATFIVGAEGTSVTGTADFKVVP